MATKRSDSLDAESQAMLYEGLNLSQLGIAFRMDHRVLVEKLHGVSPTGRRGNANTWHIHEVAPHLVKPIYDIETYIKRMHHNELPKLLTKEFWNGQRARQEYELKAGNLWKTEEVISKVGELYKLVAMSARLASDNLERHTELTPRQRDAVEGIMRGMLEDLSRRIAENFSKAPEQKTAENHNDDDL